MSQYLGKVPFFPKTRNTTQCRKTKDVEGEGFALTISHTSGP
jgi:hypothetical protein